MKYTVFHLSESPRLIWLDIAKATAIILMVLGHTSIPNFLSNFIWAFHMPLFFIASGWTTNWAKYSIMNFSLTKAKTLLVPFVVYSVIVLAIQNIIWGGNISDWFWNGWVAYALWFIPVLYLALFCARLILAIQVKTMRILALMSLLVVGILLCRCGMYLPWSLSSVPYATFMIVLGGKMRQWLSQQMLEPKWWKILILFFLTLGVSHFWRLDMCFNGILPIIPLTVGALSGTLMVFYISMLIERHLPMVTNVMTAIGRETYIIVAFSQIIIMSINHWHPMNVALKYGLLVVLLVLLKNIKDVVNKLLKTKIL